MTTASNQKTSAVKSIILFTGLTLSTGLLSLSATAANNSNPSQKNEDCDNTGLAPQSKIPNQLPAKVIVAAFKVAMGGDAIDDALVASMKVVTPADHPGYSAILDVYDKKEDKHVQLWAISQCLAVGPRHAVAKNGTKNSDILNKSYEAYVGYQDAKQGFADTRNLVPVICGQNNRSEGIQGEDICVYKSTQKFPTSVQPVQFANLNSQKISLIAKNQQLEGVGFTNESIKLAEKEGKGSFGLGTTTVIPGSMTVGAQFVSLHYYGKSGSGVFLKNFKNNKVLVGFKVGQSFVVTGEKIFEMVSQLSEDQANCQ